MTLWFIKETSDIRGKILWMESGNTEMHLVEIKKGFSRGGHYHPFDSVHVVLSGRVEYRELDLTKEREAANEIVKSAEEFAVIATPANHVHMLTAVEDTLFIELFTRPYEAVDYQPYRSIVEEQMGQRGFSD